MNQIEGSHADRLLWITFCATVAILLALPTPARAQLDPFGQGSLMLEITGSYNAGVAVWDEKFASGGGGTIGAGYYLHDNWGLYLQATGLAVTHVDPETDAAGAGVNLLLRHHLLRTDEGDRSLFVEIAGGLVRLDEEWPDIGTHTNFTGRLGIGGTIQLSEEHGLHLLGGVRWFHLSNGYRKGSDENPTYDAAEVWVGVLWAF